MAGTIKLQLQKIDRGIRFLLGERQLPKYILPFNENDSLKSAERKLIENFFKDQDTTKTSFFLKAYIYIRHIVAVLVKAPAKLLSQVIRNE